MLQTCKSLLALLAVALTSPAAGQQQYPPGPFQHPGETELILPEETQQVAVVAAHDLLPAATGEFAPWTFRPNCCSGPTQSSTQRGVAH